MPTDSDWIDAMKAKGHSPAMTDDGRLDAFFYEYGHHNGPGCDACYWSCCEHCDGIDVVPECTQPALELTATVTGGKKT